MAKTTLVFGEVRGGSLKPITRELVAAANQLAQAGGGSVALALVGHGADQALADAKTLPVTRIYTAKHDLLSAYSSQGYAVALAAIVTAGRCRRGAVRRDPRRDAILPLAPRRVATPRCSPIAPSYP